MERKLRIGVYGVATNDGHVLLTQLFGDNPFAGSWTLPGGGMDFGESPEETLLREFREETSLVPEIGALIDIISYVPRPELHVIQIIYRVDAHGDPSVLEEDGSTVDVRWVPIRQLDQLATVELVDHVRTIGEV